MAGNHLKIAWRNARRQKVYSLINIFGLAAGLAAAILIFLWIRDESSYDRFNRRADRIYRVVTIDASGGDNPFFAVTPIAMAPALKDGIPEILRAARLTAGVTKLYRGDVGIDERGLMVSPDFLEMFSLAFLEGDPASALSSPERILISEDLARRHFGSQDPLGLALHTRSGTECIVSGVFRNIPRQSHLQFDYLADFDNVAKQGRDLNRWRDISFYTYVLLDRKAEAKDVERKITALARPHLAEMNPSFALQPLKKLYLDPGYKFDNVTHGSRTSVVFFSIIAAVILLVACINFVNLSTARAGRRSKEVGLKKVVGAHRALLARQFFTESILYTLAAAGLALLAVLVLLPFFNSITGKDFSPSLLFSGLFWPSLLGMLVLTGLLSGLYPAIVLSSLRPADMFQGKGGPGSRGSSLRKVLIVFQFALAIAVIAGSLATQTQLNFLKSKDLGYDKTDLMAVYMGRNLARQAETLKERLLQNPQILRASATGNLPVELQSGSVVSEWEGKSSEGNVHLKLLWVDADYLDTLGIKMAEGRFFDREPSSGETGFVINQAAAAAMGLESPVGKRAVINQTAGRIIGVVKNFHFRSLQYVIEPVALLYEPAEFYTMVVRLRPGATDYSTTIGFIRDLWKEMAPDLTFSYTFLEDRLNRLYLSEEVLGRLFRYFTGLAVVIAGLGLLGLASYSAAQRIREIAIRKVLGASGASLVMLLVREFVQWVLVANVLALPAAFVLISRWLRNYAYHTELSPGLFLGAGLTALVLALTTVSVLSIRASLADPVVSLRHE
jgi:putative ABC transport system permease protein